MGSISRFNRPSLSADYGNWRISHSSGPARALVFLGPPGTGKTHLSLALADRALTAGYSVLFTTLAELAQALESASHPGLMRQRLRRYIAPNPAFHRRSRLHQAVTGASSPLLRAGHGARRPWLDHSDLQYELWPMGKPARRRGPGNGPSGSALAPGFGDPHQWPQLPDERAPG